MDRSRFTIVALDLPGYGKSEASEEIGSQPTMEYFQLAAKICAKLMELEGHKTYVVGGWSDGARVASLLAIQSQSRVNALLLWGFVPIMDERSCRAIAKTRDASLWDPKVLNFYSQAYGEEVFADMWKQYVDFIISTLELPERFDIRDQLKQIKCPTLVLHGQEDPIVSFSEHVKPIETQIYDSEIVQFKGMAHNIHQADPVQFNRVLTRLVDSVACA